MLDGGNEPGSAERTARSVWCVVALNRKFVGHEYCFNIVIREPPPRRRRGDPFIRALPRAWIASPGLCAPSSARLQRSYHQPPLVRKFERQTAVPFDDNAGVQRRPVVVMLMPHQPTEVQFFDQLLLALNAPSPGHFVRGCALQEPAVRLLQELGTRVIVIDELNSLLAGTPRQQRVFLQLLRFLSNELRLAFVGVGVPEARHALLSDDQLRSRFTDVELPLWSLGEDLRDFCHPTDLESAVV